MLLVPLLLALLVPITRWPVHTRFLYNWDSANFALGMRAFDVTQHQPHPPGYPYYVGLGAVLQPLFGDGNAALIAVSILLQAGAVASVYLLGRTMFSSGAGIAAGLLLAGSVTFWTYGAVALAYPALATFSSLTALFVYQTLVLGRDRLPAAAASYAIGTGFRPDLALFLLPLLAAACYRQRPRQLMLAAGIVMGGVLLWLAPVALLSGGFEEYWTAFRAYTQTDVLQKYAPSERGLEALLVNIRDTGQYTFFALYFAAAVVATGGLLLIWLRQYTRLLFFTAWTAPMLAFYVLVHIGDPGYVFGFLPALLLAGAGGWATWLRTRGVRSAGFSPPGVRSAGFSPSGVRSAGFSPSGWGGAGAWAAFAPALLALVLVGNVLVFLLHQRPLTLSGLRAADTAVDARLGYVQQFSPDDVLLVSYDSYRHFRYYLPEYAHSVWLDTQVPATQVIAVPAGVEWALLTDSSVFALAVTLPAEAEFLPGGVWLARLPVKPGQLLVYENARLALRTP